MCIMAHAVEDLSLELTHLALTSHTYPILARGGDTQVAYNTHLDAFILANMVFLFLIPCALVRGSSSLLNTTA